METPALVIQTISTAFVLSLRVNGNLIEALIIISSAQGVDVLTSLLRDIGSEMLKGTSKVVDSKRMRTQFYESLLLLLLVFIRGWLQWKELGV